MPAASEGPNGSRKGLNERSSHAKLSVGYALDPVKLMFRDCKKTLRLVSLADQINRTAVVRDPYAQWCGRGEVVRPLPIPIIPPIEAIVVFICKINES